MVAKPVSPPASTTPVLAKLILDGDVPMTAFSSRLDFGEGESLRPVNLFKEDTTLDSGSHMFLPRAHFTQKIDDKVTKAMLMHLKTRQSWGSSTCSASRSPLSRLALSLAEHSPHSRAEPGETDSGPGAYKTRVWTGLPAVSSDCI